MMRTYNKLNTHCMYWIPNGWLEVGFLISFTAAVRLASSHYFKIKMMYLMLDLICLFVFPRLDVIAVGEGGLELVSME